MGQLRYNTAYSDTRYTFADSRNRTGCSNLNGSSLMPSYGVPYSVSYNLAQVGADSSVRGQTVSVNMILTDGNGSTLTLYGSGVAPSSSPGGMTITASVSYSSTFNWNNITYIELDGPTTLVTRQGSNFLYVDYYAYTSCGAPSNVRISNTISSGYGVTLSWGAGSSGVDNYVNGYQIARRESADGKTWSGYEAVQSTNASTYSATVYPPTTFGHYYQYYVRTLGTAGTAYSSGYAACSQTLKKERPTIGAYTDPVLTAGQTRIKAAHMLELQTNINVMRLAYGKTEYSFTAIQAGYTSLGGWKSHVLEMRAAIDEINSSHSAWIAIEGNRPKASVIEQLREVVANL